MFRVTCERVFQKVPIMKLSHKPYEETVHLLIHKENSIEIGLFLLRSWFEVHCTTFDEIHVIYLKQYRFPSSVMDICFGGTSDLGCGVRNGVERVWKSSYRLKHYLSLAFSPSHPNSWCLNWNKRLALPLKIWTRSGREIRTAFSMYLQETIVRVEFAWFVTGT